MCGAGILSQKFITTNRVVNAHPGYVPLVRGLDALKWAIYEGLPIGVTTHFIGDEVDAGEIIERKIVPVRWNDTFHAVAQRQYEMEICMLVEAIEKITDEHFFECGGDYPIRKRMPHSYETRLFDRFQRLVNLQQIE